MLTMEDGPRNLLDTVVAYRSFPSFNLQIHSQRLFLRVGEESLGLVENRRSLPISSSMGLLFDCCVDSNILYQREGTGRESIYLQYALTQEETTTAAAAAIIVAPARHLFRACRGWDMIVRNDGDPESSTTWR
jgi:hypothetical protein